MDIRTQKIHLMDVRAQKFSVCGHWYSYPRLDIPGYLICTSLGSRPQFCETCMWHKDFLEYYVKVCFTPPLQSIHIFVYFQCCCWAKNWPTILPDWVSHNLHGLMSKRCVSHELFFKVQVIIHFTWTQINLWFSCSCRQKALAFCFIMFSSISNIRKTM